MEKVVLGNLEAKRDWGYAKDYVEAMWLMLLQDQPDDFVIATGRTHSIREFVQLAFKEIAIDLDWQGSGIEEKGIDRKTGKVRVEISPKYFRPAEVDLLWGDPAKARTKLGWEAKTTLEELVKIMVDYDLKYNDYGQGDE